MQIHCSHTEVWPLAKLVPNPRNPNTHPPEQLRLLAKILQAQGWRSPIVVSKRSGFIVKGHGRLEAAKLAGMESAPVDLQEYADEATEWADLVADNRLAELAEIDNAVLKDLLLELDTGAIDMELTGFTEDVLEGLMTQEHQPELDAEPQVDRADELAKKWKVKPGQVWQCGEHRVMCGDSGSVADVNKLLHTFTPKTRPPLLSAVLTDPPYGQNQAGIPNDDPSQLENVLQRTFSIIPMEDGICVAFQSPRTFPCLLDICRAHGFIFERMLWLDKVAQCAYPWRGWILKSESILIFTKGKADWHDVHPYQHDIYRLPEVSGELPKDCGWHGSVKPISVVLDICNRISQSGQSVYDPFLGSGTTLIACEQLNRKCYGMEISPGYVAVTLQRFMDATGKKPKKIHG